MAMPLIEGASFLTTGLNMKQLLRIAEEGFGRQANLESFYYSENNTHRIFYSFSFLLYSLFVKFWF